VGRSSNVCAKLSTFHCFFPENNTGRAILYLSYDPKLKTWSRTTIKTDQATAFGVSAASRKELGFMGFQRNSSNGQMYLNLFDGRCLACHQGQPSWGYRLMSQGRPRVLDQLA
jgi:hypothetical protein